MAIEALEKKRESKIKRAREEKIKAIELTKAENARRLRIKEAKIAHREAHEQELARLQKKLDLVTADKA